MSRMRAGALLFTIQLLVVLSVAGKFYYERQTRPRVWVRATQYDPQLPMRGRYMELRLLVDSCGLPHDKTHFSEGFSVPKEAIARSTRPGRSPGSYDWKVTVAARDGRLVMQDDEYVHLPSEVGDVHVKEDEPCDRATYTPGLNFFIPDTAKRAAALKKGEELWAEVTVPKQGPPRPVQLAISDGVTFRVLKF
jgi:hypothetical protein